MFCKSSFHLLFFRATDPVRNFKGPQALFRVWLIVTVLYCNARIDYLKWKRYQEEKVSERSVQNQPMRIFPNCLLLADSNENAEIPIPNQNQGIQLNTRRYNKIIAEMKHTLIFCFSAAFIFIIRTCQNHFVAYWDGTPMTSQSKIMLYILDLGWLLLFSFIFPLLFYYSHQELRTYWKNIFKICRRNQA